MPEKSLEKGSAEDKLFRMRHSCAHVLAQAVLEMFPDAKLGIGPAIDNGFYYDFDLPRTLIPEDLAILEEKMQRITNEKQPFKRYETKIDEAAEVCRKAGQSYKVELLRDLKKEGVSEVSFYENLNNDGHLKFVDLCKGPHVEDTGKIGAFKLTTIAGAYWRGIEKNKMLQRIYGVCFKDKKELNSHLQMLEEAKKRDHRKLGKELNIFIFDEDTGPGLPLWLPNGTILIEELERLAKETELAAGYKRVRTPHIAKESMYRTSGHLPYYQDSMFPPMDCEGVKYYLKAMNCPHHHKIYNALVESYKDLPLRLAEYGTCYRYEKTGELFGLMRVRSLQMNDAHMYCTEEQFASEFEAVNQMYLKYFKIFGIEKYVMRFSTHDPAKLGEKYVDEPELWKKTEDMVRKTLKESRINYMEVADEAAFYGPKIDVQIWSAIGREFTLATNQVDFAQPRRFGLTYKNSKGSDETPIVIHRAPLGTHERTIGFLIEHFAGTFPLWLSPVQVKLIPVSEKHQEYVEKLAGEMGEEGFRVEIDQSNETVGKKIRNAELEKIPYMLVIGDKEKDNNILMVRKFGEKAQEEMPLKQFISMVKKKIGAKEIGY